MSEVNETKPVAATQTRKGLAFITSAKLYFIVTGYGVQLFLPALLGSAENFGRFAAVMNIAAILNNVLIASTIQTVSKKVSDDEENADAVLRQALRIQLVVGSVLSIALFLLAPVIAGRGLLNPQLGAYLRITSLVIFAYALYAAIVGYLNGRRRFSQQAGLDMTFSTLRTGGLLILPALGFGIGGAFLGFASAAAVVLLVAMFRAGIGKPGKETSLASWFHLLLPLWIYQLCLNLILQIDLSVLGRTIAEIGLKQGLNADDAANLSSRFVGLYRAAQTFAFVPYQLIISVTFIIFPLIAKATSSGDHEVARQQVQRAMRLSLLVLLAIASPIAGAARGVIHIAYKNPEYLEADNALRVLALGMVPFSLFVIGATILSGAGRARVSAIIAFSSLVALIIFVRVFVMFAGATPNALVAAALGTTAGASSALIAVAVVVHQRFQAFLPVFSVIRALIAAAVAGFVASIVPEGSKLLALLALALGFGVYGIMLVLTREITRDEIAAVMNVLRRKKG